MKKTYTPEEKKNLRHLFWRSGHFWANFNMVKMMGQTYAFCLFPILNEVYAGKEDLRRSARRRPPTESKLNRDRKELRRRLRRCPCRSLPGKHP